MKTPEISDFASTLNRSSFSDHLPEDVLSGSLYDLEAFLRTGLSTIVTGRPVMRTWGPAELNLASSLPGVISTNPGAVAISATLAGNSAMATATGETVTTAFEIFDITGVADPLAADQWHLARLGNIESVWKDYTGAGVSVGVYDSGVQYAHSDLDGNYDASKHVVVDGVTYDGDYRPASGPHGTSVAGLIAAERNGEGGVGVAYGSSLTGVNIFDPYSLDDSDPGIFVNQVDRTRFNDAIAQSVQFDVVNHSWGGLGGYMTVNSRSTAGSFAYDMAEGIARTAEAGRDGLGTIQVAAAGNSIIDGQADGWKTDRHVVTVGAYREVDGNSAYYVNTGAHLLVSAGSSDFLQIGGTGQVTTDLIGRDGYNTIARPGGASDHTDAFGGTSGATPIVSGVVSLMLDANADLGWRDVKDILAASAKMPVAFEIGATQVRFEDSDLFLELNARGFDLAGQNAGWNGGAMHYSNDYGYGAVDAYNAVRMAEVWSLFGEAKTSANEVSFSTGQIDVGLLAANGGQIPETNRFGDFIGEPARFTFDIGQDVDVDHIDLSLNFTTFIQGPGYTIDFSNLGLKIKLIAPDGTEGYIDLDSAPIETASGPQEYTFGLSGFRGVETAGTWTAEFEQAQYSFGEFTTTINSLKVDVFGDAPTADDVFTYTNEFFTMKAIASESDRGTLTDSNGGVDWINMAAVSGDVVSSLVAGAATSIGGTKAFNIDRKAVIENVVTGDGNDFLTGNGLDNQMLGMRGNDKLIGAAGNDKLEGGVGNDVLDGGAGSDILDGGDGVDTILFKVGATSGVTVDLANTAAQNTGRGVDTIINVEIVEGTGFADMLAGSAAANTIKGLEGNDTIRGRAGADDLTGGAGADSFVFEAASANGYDRIRDFVSGTDTLVFSTADGYAADTGLTFGKVSVGTDAQFVYDKASRNLYYDADGFGGADQILIANVSGIAASDILIKAALPML